MMDLQTFIHIVLHIVGHTDSLSSFPVFHLMQKHLSTQCHNISRPIRQMNPHFQNTKHRFQLVCESQPSHIESIMCQADPSPPNQSPPSFPNSFPYNVEGEAQFVFNKRSRDLW